MNDNPSHPPPDQEMTTSSHHASYILRCWTGDLGQIRARLIDVHSGVTWPVADLFDLPGLLQRLMDRAAPKEQE
jgi:hypothetical protein